MNKQLTGSFLKGRHSLQIHTSKRGFITSCSDMVLCLRQKQRPLSPTSIENLLILFTLNSTSSLHVSIVLHSLIVWAQVGWQRCFSNSISISLPSLFAMSIRGLERIWFEERKQCRCQNTVCAPASLPFKCISHSPSKETRKGKRDPGSCLFYTFPHSKGNIH